MSETVFYHCVVVIQPVKTIYIVYLLEPLTKSRQDKKIPTFYARHYFLLWLFLLKLGSSKIQTINLRVGSGAPYNLACATCLHVFSTVKKCTKTCDWLDIITPHSETSLCVKNSMAVLWSLASENNIHCFFTQTFDQKQARQKNPNISCTSFLSPLAISPEAGQQQDSNYRSQSWQWSTLPLCYCSWPASFYFTVKNAQKPQWLDKIIAAHFRDSILPLCCGYRPVKTIYIVYLLETLTKKQARQNSHLFCMSLLLLHHFLQEPCKAKIQTCYFLIGSGAPCNLAIAAPCKFLFHGRKCTKTCEWLDKIIAAHFREISLRQYSTTVLRSSASENKIHCLFIQTFWPKVGKTEITTFYASHYFVLWLFLLKLGSSKIQTIDLRVVSGAPYNLASATCLHVFSTVKKCTKTCDWLDKIITSHWRHISLHQVFYHCAVVIGQLKQ